MLNAKQARVKAERARAQRKEAVKNTHLKEILALVDEASEQGDLNTVYEAFIEEKDWCMLEEMLIEYGFGYSIAEDEHGNYIAIQLDW